MADIEFTKENIRAGEGAMVEVVQANAATENGESLEILPSGKARKTAGASAGCVGIQVATENKSASAAANEYVSYVRFGPVVGFEDLTPGALYYLSANAGNIAETGSIAVGYARDANTIMVMPALADIPYQ